MPLVYERLRQLAHQRLRNEPGASLNTTALVHEVYLKLADTPQASMRDRSHFLALASRVMRHLLVDHARARKALKRGAGVTHSDVDELIWITDEDVDAVTDLDGALRKLECMDARQSRILEQRYFGGLSLAETAEALDISLATVKRELRAARAWLATELESESA
jgi:RNA polymerase sigma factor (TIGR02999 family)